MTLYRNQISLLLLIAAMPVVSAAACEIVDGGKKHSFDGKNTDGIQIEKRSLPFLNKEFPSLNAAEKAFKGEVQTCTTCSGKFIVCDKE